MLAPPLIVKSANAPARIASAAVPDMAGTAHDGQDLPPFIEFAGQRVNLTRGHTGKPGFPP